MQLTIHSQRVVETSEGIESEEASKASWAAPPPRDVAMTSIGSLEASTRATIDPSIPSAPSTRTLVTGGRVATPTGALGSGVMEPTPSGTPRIPRGPTADGARFDSGCTGRGPGRTPTRRMSRAPFAVITNLHLTI